MYVGKELLSCCCHFLLNYTNKLLLVLALSDIYRVNAADIQEEMLALQRVADSSGVSQEKVPQQGAAAGASRAASVWGGERASGAVFSLRGSLLPCSSLGSLGTC